MTVTIWPLPALDVSLERIEIAYSEYIANTRMADVQRHKRMNVADLAIGDDERRNHLLGALGEHAFAKWLGVQRPLDGQYGVCPLCRCYAGTVNTFKAGGDVGRYQVRTRSFTNAPLIVRDGDRDDDVFVLVVAHTVGYPLPPSGIFWIIGWIYAADAKQWVFRRDPDRRGAAYFVPQNSLREITTLPLDSPPQEAHDGDK
jgi:hypothetical protein